MKQGAEMAISYYCNIGNCPVCGNPVESYHVIPCTSVYVFNPCGCKSQTWTVIDGKFVGKSSQDIPPTTDDRTLARIESRLRGISQRCGVACKPEWIREEIDQLANLLRTWQT